LEYVLKLVHPYMFYFLGALALFSAILRFRFVRNVFLRYSLGSVLKKNNFASYHPYKKILFSMRFLFLLVLAFIIGKPRLVDPHSSVIVDGIDIMLVLDVSGSMQCCDSGEKEKSRFDVARQEALRFINKRENDPIGLVVFGGYAITLCPITLDRNILSNMLKDLKLGVVNPGGTVLSRSILTAANRLKDSESKSKIIILLTDGEPSEGDVSPELAINIAKKLGIKIYTIGIGPDETSYIRHPVYGILPLAKVNKELLKKISLKTGGRFFMAKNSKDMRMIYETIDKLEKTEYQTDIYSNYLDVFMPFLWFIFILFLFELFLSLFVWFCL